jgi:Mg-chelatase subunit ChlD
VLRALAAAVLAALPFFAIEVHVEVQPRTPITRRVLFVVDRSGSMHGDQFGRALACVHDMFEHASDELEVGLLAFNDATARWPGRPEPDKPRPVPQGWAALPSDEAVEAANAWLEELGAGGDTLVIPALREALAEPREQLSIVLVSDGLFGRERTDDIMATLSLGQQSRERQGLGPAIVGVYGLGPAQKILALLGDEGQGGYVREDLPPEEDDLGPPPPLPPTTGTK